MSKKTTPRSTFDLSSKTFIDYINDQLTHYYVYFPDSKGNKGDVSFESTNILEILDYCYGIDKFLIESDKCFCVNFDSNYYSEKDCKRAGYFEPFDFLVHNILTDHELNLWKIRQRTSMEF